MSIQFHDTVMGRRFIEGTMPELVAQLRRLNDNLEKFLALEQEQEPPPGAPPKA